MFIVGVAVSHRIAIANPDLEQFMIFAMNTIKQLADEETHSVDFAERLAQDLSRLGSYSVVFRDAETHEEIEFPDAEDAVTLLIDHADYEPPLRTH